MNEMPSKREILRDFTRALATGSAIIAAGALVGKALKITVLQNWSVTPAVTMMALPTAVAVLFLSISILLMTLRWK